MKRQQKYYSQVCMMAIVWKSRCLSHVLKTICITILMQYTFCGNFFSHASIYAQLEWQLKEKKRGHNKRKKIFPWDQTQGPASARIVLYHLATHPSPNTEF